MRRHTTVGIDFVGWERKNGLLDLRVGKALGRGEEKPRVNGEALDVRIRRDDEQHPIACRCASDKHRLRRRDQPRHPRGAHTNAQPAEGLFSRARSANEVGANVATC